MEDELSKPLSHKKNTATNSFFSLLLIKSWDSCQVRYYPDSISFDQGRNAYISNVAISFSHGSDTAGINTGLLIKLKDDWKMMPYPYWLGHTR